MCKKNLIRRHRWLSAFNVLILLLDFSVRQKVRVIFGSFDILSKRLNSIFIYFDWTLWRKYMNGRKKNGWINQFSSILHNRVIWMVNSFSFYSTKQINFSELLPNNKTANMMENGNETTYCCWQLILYFMRIAIEFVSSI